MFTSPQTHIPFCLLLTLPLSICLPVYLSTCPPFHPTTYLLVRQQWIDWQMRKRHYRLRFLSMHGIYVTWDRLWLDFSFLEITQLYLLPWTSPKVRWRGVGVGGGSACGQLAWTIVSLRLLSNPGRPQLPRYKVQPKTVTRARKLQCTNSNPVIFTGNVFACAMVE